MLILEDNFRRHLEAFVSELFIYMYMCVCVYVYVYVYSSQHLKWIKKVNQTCPKTRMCIVLVLGQLWWKVLIHFEYWLLYVCIYVCCVCVCVCVCGMCVK